MTETLNETKPVSESKGIRFLSAGSAGVAMLTLAKGTLGAGILALPQKAMYGGIPLFLVLLFIGGYFTTKSIEMIAKGCQYTNKYVFEEVTESLLGRKMAITLGVSMLLNCYGASIIYVMAIKGAFSCLLTEVVASTGQEWSMYATIILGGAILVPLSVVEKINSLRILSLAGVVGVFFTTASVIYALGYDGVAADLSAPPASSTWTTIMTPTGSFIQIIGVISAVTFAFCNQFNVPQVYGELVDKRAGTVKKIAVISTILPSILYIITAITGYLAVGLATEDNIFINMKPLIRAGKVLVYFGVLAVVLSVAMCHLLNNFPMRLSVVYFVPSHWAESKWIRFGVPLFTAVSTIVIAIFYDNLSVVLGLVGALTGSVICYIVPALFSVRVDEIQKATEQLPGQPAPVVKKSLTNRAMYYLKNYPVEVLMVILGFLIGIVGTFSEFYTCFKK